MQKLLKHIFEIIATCKVTVTLLVLTLLCVISARYYKTIGETLGKDAPLNNLNFTMYCEHGYYFLSFTEQSRSFTDAE